MEPYNPADHTVAEVNEYLAQADESERDRVLDAEAERDGGGRSTVNGYAERQAALAEQAKAEERAAAEQANDDATAEEAGPEGGENATPEDARKSVAATTKAATFADAAKAATPSTVGYLGTSPERERTGLADKGLSQASVLKRGNKPGPDPRQGVDDSAALNKG